MTKELFLTDSYQHACTANVQNINKNKVVLDQTVFYAEGGGQPGDIGVLKQGEQTFRVEKTKRENGQIVHFLDDDENLAPDEVEARIDWDRRYSFMRYHTLLHIIGGYLYNQLGALATGNQIHSDRARIDLKSEVGIPSEEFDRMEREVNQLIRENRAVTTRVLDRKEAETIPGSIKTVINLLPSSVEEVRLVAIEDLDEQACGGTHVKETGEVGPFSITKIKNKGENIKRVEVVLVEHEK